jgi:hypothetical protein
VPSQSATVTVSSWSYIGLQNVFTRSQAVPAAHNFTLDGTNNMVNAATGIVNTWTNATWGAVAYLSQSLYGICTGRYCSKDGAPLTTEGYAATTNMNGQRVLNNGVSVASTSFGRTGCGPAVAIGTSVQVDAATTICNPWFDTTGQTASTTQNQSGIYDVAGGVWEYAFSNLSKADDLLPDYSYATALGSNTAWSFNKFTDVLYRLSDFKNSHAYDTVPRYNGGLAVKTGSFFGLSRYYGTALAETVAQNIDPARGDGGWGGDQSPVPDNAAGNHFYQYTWFTRGGGDAKYSLSFAGIFATNSYSGAGDQNNIGWRAVVSGV